MREIKTLTFNKMFNPQTGKTMSVSGEESINDCLSMLICTTKGELLGDPNFGTNIRQYLLTFETESLKVIVREEILRAISTYEKRVVVEDEDINIYKVDGGDENTFHIDVMYKDLTDGTTKELALTLNGDEL